MEFNYGLEKKKFEENWEKLRKEYQEAGMDDKSIEKMYEYDWDMFKKERIWCIHNQFIDGEYQCAHNGVWKTTEDSNPLYYLFPEQFTYTFSEEDFEADYAWMEALESESLYDAIASLDDDQRHILELRVIDELTLREIAEIYGIAIGSVNDRIRVIYKKIKKYVK